MVVRRTAIGLVLIALVALVQTDFQVHAQNAGNVGIYTREVPVFTAQSTATSSAILPDFGFGANYLTYCNTGFTGTIDLEWSPTGSAPFIALAQASYVTATDSNCHVLQVGGYFPNLRSTVNPTAGTISAWYSASSAPIAYAPSGIGSNGPTAPPVCDLDAVAVGIATGTTGPSNASPRSPGDLVLVCGFTISFNGTPSTGSISLVWSASGACTSAPVTWEAYTAASTPQLFNVLLPQRGPNSTLQYPCVLNSSGVSVDISVSYASVHSL